jgi:NAD(P)-dependent dehydrogenase (short-subunit alcohol dehydrogenase family)
MEKIWFITGASKGLGLALVKQLLKEGYKVAGTSRDLAGLKNAVGDAATADFLPLTVDLLDEDSVARALYDTVRYFGRVDVIVNSAKYGLAGSIEELSDKETRRNFDVNVFGSLNVIRGALPFLREQKSGHIFNISSVGGFTGEVAGFGIYRATELAVLGFSESLAAEVKPFGINVTTVTPGYFRTNFLSADPLAVPKRRINGYKPAKDMQQLPQDRNYGNVDLVTERAANTFISIAAEKEPPLFLFLEPDTCGVSMMKTRKMETSMSTVRKLAASFHV